MQTTIAPAPASFGGRLHFNPADMRRERRHTLPMGVKIKVQTSPQNKLVDAELRDISRNGVGFIAVGLIPSGTSINFPFGSQRIFAQVRYCCAVGTGFVVGALILEVAERGVHPPAVNV